VFGCSNVNDRLALVCGGNRTWDIRETCVDDERCYPLAGDNLGLCQAPLPECTPSTAEPVCKDGHVAQCIAGGLETEITMECPADSVCSEGECVLRPDECPVGGYQCEGDPCDGFDVNCPLAEGEQCYAQADPPETSGSVFRLPVEGFCGDECEPTRASLSLNYSGVSDFYIRVTVGPGWQMRDASLGCAADWVEGCLVSASDAGDARNVVFAPTTDPPVARNVTVEQVPEGATCP
jgi:hypothetical protein